MISRLFNQWWFLSFPLSLPRNSSGQGILPFPGDFILSYWLLLLHHPFSCPTEFSFSTSFRSFAFQHGHQLFPLYIHSLGPHSVLWLSITPICQGLPTYMSGSGLLQQTQTPISNSLSNLGCLSQIITVVVQSLNHVQLFVTLWTTTHQASLSFTTSQSLLKLMSIESVMPSNFSSSVVPFSSCLQSLQWVSSSHQVAEVLELQHQVNLNLLFLHLPNSFLTLVK